MRQVTRYNNLGHRSKHNAHFRVRVIISYPCGRGNIVIVLALWSVRDS